MSDDEYDWGKRDPDFKPFVMPAKGKLSRQQNTYSHQFPTYLFFACHSRDLPQ